MSTRNWIVLGLIAVSVIGLSIRGCRSFQEAAQDPTMAILRVDQAFDFPPGMPGDPGLPGRSTLGGLDSDGDGVRDDVQRWIHALHPGLDSAERFALRQMARAYQDLLRSDFDRSKVRVDHWERWKRALECSRVSYKDVQAFVWNERFLRAKMFNTYERTLRFLENSKLYLPSEVMTGLPDTVAPCERK